MTTPIKDVIVKVMRDGRVRPILGHPLVNHYLNVRFPKHLRDPGRRFRCDITLVPSGNHYFASVRTIARVADDAEYSRAAAAPAPAPAPAPPRIPVPAPQVLEADDVIDGGRDAAFKPGASARHSYATVCESNTEHGAALSRAAREHAGEWAEWGAFVREVFAVLTDDGTPPLPDEERSKWAAEAVRVLSSQPEWETLRRSCQATRVAAANATVALAAAVAPLLPRAKADEAKNDPRALTDYKESSASMLDSAGFDPSQVSDALVDVQAAIDDADGVRAVAWASVGKAAATLRVRMLEAVKEAEALADAARAACAFGFSLTGPRSLSEVCPELLTSMAEDERIKRILAFVGRLRDVADGALARTAGRVSIRDISITSEIGQVLAEERARMAVPGAVGAAAFLRLLNGEALGFEGEQDDPRADGELVILYDRSGSMSYGDKDTEARALAIASLLTAYKASRRVVLVTFAASDEQTSVVCVPGDHASLAACIRELCRPSDGTGTDVAAALACAVRQAPKRPDVLVITDGVFPVLESADLAPLGEARLFGVFIGTSGAAAMHSEFSAGWDVSAIDEKAGAEIINAIRKPRAKRAA